MTKFVGFSKLYNNKGVLISNLAVMSDSEKVGFNVAETFYSFYSCDTGMHICSKSRKDCHVNKNDAGIEYICSYRDDLGQYYFISPITKTITKTIEVTVEL